MSMVERTLIYFHICQSLPFVHGNDPLGAISPTAQIND